MWALEQGECFGQPFCFNTTGSYVTVLYQSTYRFEFVLVHLGKQMGQKWYQTNGSTMKAGLANE
jgi:hypothetical protein